MYLKNLIQKAGSTIALSAIAFLSAIDEALEAIGNIVDLFGLDAFHGVLSLSILAAIKGVKEAMDGINEVRKKSKKEN